jgi:transposase-like protein/IS1 family transposase
MKSLSCPNRRCSRLGKAAAGTIIRHGSYITSCGKRRRYRCRICLKTFSSNTATPYYRLQHRRATFDEVAALSVEGLTKSAIARVKRIAWNTVHRWLEKAADWSRRFNDRTIRRLTAAELQADEIKTIVGGKKQQIWVFAVIEVWSRLWPSTVVGKRSYQNTLSLFRDLSSRMNFEQIPLVVTDGFGFYERVIGRVFGGHQDPQERSDREGGAKNRAWRCVAIETGTA